MAWLVVALLVLPLARQGLLGLSEGVITPVIWALILVAYCLVWDLAWDGPMDDRPVDLERRRIVTMGPLAIGLGSLALIGVLKLPGWVQAIAAPPESSLTGPVPEITPVKNFYRVLKNFQDPVVAEAGWTLRVNGLVQRPLNLTYQQLRHVPPTTQVMTLECISNDVGGDLMSTGRFTGIPMRDLLTMGAPRTGATGVNFTPATDTRRACR